MKSATNRIVIALVITVMTGVLAFANNKKETITFPTDMQVGGTLVKKGTYKVKFDDQTHELLIVDGKKVLARTTTTVEKRSRKARGFLFSSMANGETDTKRLVSITFSGSNENIVVSQGGGQAEGSN
ncbi:MAG: hypothetical protein ACR2G5_08755 [Pyrinomonadaceae bacterium]